MEILSCVQFSFTTIKYQLDGCWGEAKTNFFREHLRFVWKRQRQERSLYRRTPPYTIGCMCEWVCVCVWRYERPCQFETETTQSEGACLRRIMSFMQWYFSKYESLNNFLLLVSLQTLLVYEVFKMRTEIPLTFWNERFSAICRIICSSKLIGCRISLNRCSLII